MSHLVNITLFLIKPAYPRASSPVTSTATRISPLNSWRHWRGVTSSTIGIGDGKVIEHMSLGATVNGCDHSWLHKEREKQLVAFHLCTGWTSASAAAKFPLAHLALPVCKVKSKKESEPGGCENVEPGMLGTKRNITFIQIANGQGLQSKSYFELRHLKWLPVWYTNWNESLVLVIKRKKAFQVALQVLTLSPLKCVPSKFLSAFSSACPTQSSKNLSAPSLSVPLLLTFGSGGNRKSVWHKMAQLRQKQKSPHPHPHPHPGSLLSLS